MAHLRSERPWQTPHPEESSGEGEMKCRFPDPAPRVRRGEWSSPGNWHLPRTPADYEGRRFTGTEPGTWQKPTKETLNFSWWVENISLPQHAISKKQCLRGCSYLQSLSCWGTQLLFLVSIRQDLSKQSVCELTYKYCALWKLAKTGFACIGRHLWNQDHVQARPRVLSAGQWGCEVHGKGCGFSKSSHPKCYTEQTEAEMFAVCFASTDCGKVLFSPDFVSEGSKEKSPGDACSKNLSWWFELSNLVLLHRPDDLWIILVSFCSLYACF